jgi:hypothetical protein
MLDLKVLQPKKILGLGRYPLPHKGDLSKPYFIAVGCSFTAGARIDYNDVWCNQLGSKLNLEHINLSYQGSSLEYQYEKILQSETILSNAKFILWMQTYPPRSHRFFLRDIIGDFYSRIIPPDKPIIWEKVEYYYNLVSHKKILITNCWGWDLKTKILLKAKICKKNKNYFFNKNNPIDYGSDNLHPGPKSHSILANDMYDHMTKHFSSWI